MTLYGTVVPRYVQGGPSIVTLSYNPISKGKMEIMLDASWQNFWHRFNPDQKVWEIILNPKVGPVSGANNGKIRYISATWSGARVRILEVGSTWYKIQTLDTRLSPPSTLWVNSVTRPIILKVWDFLFPLMTTYDKLGRKISVSPRWDSAVCIVAAPRGFAYIPKEMVKINP